MYVNNTFVQKNNTSQVNGKERPAPSLSLLNSHCSSSAPLSLLFYRLYNPTRTGCISVGHSVQIGENDMCPLPTHSHRKSICFRSHTNKQSHSLIQHKHTLSHRKNFPIRDLIEFSVAPPAQQQQQQTRRSNERKTPPPTKKKCVDTRSIFSLFWVWWWLVDTLYSHVRRSNVDIHSNTHTYTNTQNTNLFFETGQQRFRPFAGPLCRHRICGVLRNLSCGRMPSNGNSVVHTVAVCCVLCFQQNAFIALTHTHTLWDRRCGDGQLLLPMGADMHTKDWRIARNLPFVADADSLNTARNSTPETCCAGGRK